MTNRLPGGQAVPLIGHSPTPSLRPSSPHRALADLAALACVVGALALGWAVYTTILTLTVVANAAIGDGRNAGLALASINRDLAGLPLAGTALQSDLGGVQSIPRTVTTVGYQELHAIGRLALLSSVFVVAVPLLVLACTYLPWQLRQRSEHG